MSRSMSSSISISSSVSKPSLERFLRWRLWRRRLDPVRAVSEQTRWRGCQLRHFAHAPMSPSHTSCLPLHHALVPRPVKFRGRFRDARALSRCAGTVRSAGGGAYCSRVGIRGRPSSPLPAPRPAARPAARPGSRLSSFPPLWDARIANEVRFEVELGERAVLGQCPGQGGCRRRRGGRGSGCGG